MSSNTDRPIQVGEEVWGKNRANQSVTGLLIADTAFPEIDMHRYHVMLENGSVAYCSEVHRLEQPQEPSIPASVVKKMMMEIWQMAYGFDEHKFGIVDGEDIRSIAKEHLSKYGVTF